MEAPFMSLTILLPFRVFAEVHRVKRIVAETGNGAFGLLPHRLDCVAALVPGILVFEKEGEKENYLAIDEGILVKTGLQVMVSVRRAISGAPLGKLHELVTAELKQLDETETDLRFAMAKLESGFIRHFEKLKNE